MTTHRIGLGGFFLDNIKNSIINDCYSSGDPENFFWNLLDVIEELKDDQSWLDEALASGEDADDLGTAG